MPGVQPAQPLVRRGHAPLGAVGEGRKPLGHRRPVGDGPAGKLAIRENFPDTDENGPPMGLGEEREALPLPASDLLAAAVDLAQNRTGEMTGEQYTRTAGALMAVATHMLGAQSEEVWTSCRTPRFPFSMRLDPDQASPGRREK